MLFERSLNGREVYFVNNGTIYRGRVFDRDKDHYFVSGPDGKVYRIEEQKVSRNESMLIEPDNWWNRAHRNRLYNPGDRVRIVDHRVTGMNLGGKMDHYLGEVVTIRCLTRVSWDEYGYRIEEAGGLLSYDWVFTEEMIVGREINQVGPSYKKTLPLL